MTLPRALGCSAQREAASLAAAWKALVTCLLKLGSPLLSVLVFQSDYWNTLKDPWLKKGFLFLPSLFFFFLSSQAAPSAGALHFSLSVMVSRSVLYLLGV